MNLLRGTHSTPSTPKHEHVVPTVTEVPASPTAVVKASPIHYDALSHASSHGHKSNGLVKDYRKSARVSSHGFKKHEYVRDEHVVIRRRAQHELGANISTRVINTSYTELLEWIRSERLTRLPHKASGWDRVLSAAQYFAEQVHGFEAAVEAFTDESSAAAQFIYGQSLLLLELGHENANALTKAFKLFTQFGVEISVLLRRADLFRFSSVIQENLGRVFVDLMNIVSGVAIHFHHAVHGHSKFVTLDIYVVFHSLIETFRSRVATLAEDMWDYSLGDDQEVRTLRRWLAPQDTVLAALASNHLNFGSQQAEYTCNWFQSHLVNFYRSNEKTLRIEGKSGAGKTTLAHWIRDRLHRPIARHSVSTLSFFFNPSIAAQSTSLAMVKTLLYQLLEQRIGDEVLYDALLNAYHECKSSTQTEKHEEAMWTALNTVLESLRDEREDEGDFITIIVDGLDEIEGRKPVANRISARLFNIAQAYPMVRLILSSQPIETKAKSSVTVSLNPADTANDIRSLLQQVLTNHSHFREQSETDREQMVEKLLMAAEGSILWTKLATAWLMLHTSHESFFKAFEQVMSSPKTLNDIVVKLLTAMSLSKDSKNLLMWLVAAERPLTFSEVKILLQAQPEHGYVSERNVNVPALIEAIRPFVIVGEGLVFIAHQSLETAFLAIPSTSPASLHLKERHKDFLMRLLVYAKTTQHDDLEVTFDSVGHVTLEKRFRSNLLLEYAVRYWATHFKLSSLYKSSGDLDLSALTNIFPSSTSFAVLEKTCWYWSSYLVDTLDLHTLALRVRQTIFGLEHASVLQSMVSCGLICEKLARPDDCTMYFGRASKTSRIVLGVQSSITLACCNAVIRYSETLITKTRTSVVTYREETLLIMVEVYKHTYGASSKEVLEIYQKLLDLYVFISEETKIIEIREVIQRITIVIYGERSDEAEKFSGSLDVTLRRHKHHDDVDTYDKSYFAGYIEDYSEEWTIRYVESLIVLAGRYVLEGKFSLAEEIYIDLWLRLTTHCRTHHVFEWHEKKIELMLVYAQFLQARGRISESSSILICIWREYEYHEFSVVEKVIMHLKEVAILMKKVGLIAVALTVFKKCWSFFKSTHQEHTEIYKRIEEYISITSKEIIETTTKTSTTTTSEEVIKEVFESSFESSTTEVSTTTVEMCKSLTSIYMKSERYYEASKTIKKVIKKSWSSFFSSSFESVSITSVHKESLDLVASLAICYLKMSRYEKAEMIYLRLYHAVRSAYKLDHVLVTQYIETLVEFYKAHKFTSKLIAFYQQLLVDYRAFYGVSHTIVIGTLYALGDLCRAHTYTHGYWLEYYLEIVTVLNKGAIVCHRDALRALIIIAETYYEESRYSEATIYFKIIASTFFKFGSEYKYFAEVKIQEIFEHYFKCLIECKTELKVRISIIKEYRESCVRYFGASSTITISATEYYAEECERSEEYQYEAISLYEEIMKYSKSTETITKCKKSLKTLYVKRVFSSTSTSTTTTVTTATLETAVTLVYERYLEIRKTYSCTHETILSTLKELVMLYHRLSKVELATKELRTLIIEIITKTTITKELIESGRFLAEIYRSCGYVEYAHELIREIKMQLIFKSTTHTSKWGFNLVSLGHACFSFLAAFEASLYVEMGMTISVCMAELLAYSLYYEKYTHALKSHANIETVFAAAAKLRHALYKPKPLDYYWTIEQDVTEYFLKRETTISKVVTVMAAKAFVVVILNHFGQHRSQNFVAAAGAACVRRVRELLEQKKHKDAYELATCTFKFLMAHEGLDEVKEISQGFQICILMAGRGVPPCTDANLQKNMLALSREVLQECLKICKQNHINLARLQIDELNDLIYVMGEQKDYMELEDLLRKLWDSREGQSKWSQDTIMNIARRLIQASFGAGHLRGAISLCEDIVYNVRRVHGAKHPHTLEFHTLLAQLYTSMALYYQKQEGQTAKDLARSYFKQAMNVHEIVLKQAVYRKDISADDDDDDDENDLDSEIGSDGGHDDDSPLGANSHANSRQLEAVRRHLRLLKLSHQRLGAWSKSSSTFENLTSAVWRNLESKLNMSKNNVVASQWNVQNFGNGKAESEEDVFAVPKDWAVM